MRRAVVFFFSLFFLAAATLPAAAELVIDEDAVINRIDRKPGETDDFCFSPGAKLLEIWFPNIRDADAAVLIYDGQVWMIDCGDERAALRTVKMLAQLNITRIDRLYNSHPHHDHLNGLPILHASVPVEELLVCFPEDSTQHMIDAAAFCGENHIQVTHYNDGDSFSMGDGQVLLTFHMADDPQLGMNDRSAITKVQYGSRSILFAADLENRGQRALLNKLRPEDLLADVIKYPHHGKIGLVEEFYQAVGFSLAVVTNSRGMRDGTRFLMYKHVDYAFTNRNEYYVHLMTDGEHWLCENAPIEP